MTVRPPRTCVVPGCPEPVRGPGSRCTTHRQEARRPADLAARERDPARYDFYRSRRWKKIRLWVLRVKPLCERHLGMTPPRRVAAKEVHHKDGDYRHNSLSNLEALCAFCHRSEGGRSRGKGRKEA